MHHTLGGWVRTAVSAVTVVLLSTGCGFVNKVTSCAQLADEGTRLSQQANSGDVQGIIAESGEYARKLRDVAAKTSDPKTKAAMITLAEDFEILDRVGTGQALSPADLEIAGRIPGDAQALRQACGVG
jgi:hypothetical protein